MEISRKFQLLLVWFSILFAVVWSATNALAQAVELQPDKGIANIGPYLKYHSDPQATLSTVLDRFQNGKFENDLEASMLASNYAPETWAGVEIVNATLADGRVPDPYVVTLSLALSSAVDIYVVRKNGFTENLLKFSAFDAYVAEQHSVTRLRTPLFTIAPQETVTLLVNFKFGPIQSFLMALETPVELEASAFKNGIAYTAFYAFCISCLIFFFGFNLAMKNLIGGFYVLLFTLALGIIAYIDGILFRFVYPDEPGWHSVIGFGLLFAISAFGLLLAGRSIVVENKESRLSIILSALSILPIAGFLVSLFSPGTYVAFSAYVFLLVMLIANFIAGSEWKKRGGKIQVGAQLISAVSIVTFGTVIGLMIVGWANNSILVPDAIKAVFAVLLLATMITLTAHIINLRLLHAKAVKLQIAALKEEAQRSHELLSAEKNYSRVRDLANLRQRQLATASHDLKQPIASLRMTFDAIAENTDPKIRKRLREAFDYMDALSSDYLQETMPDNDQRQELQEENQAAISLDEAEVYELSIILGTIYQMFHEEAVSKGLQFRFVNSSLLVQIPPIILMRIVSNLVSNAVKYTLKGTVLIGGRRSGTRVILQIVDTGPGMDAREIDQFKVAYQKGDTSQGQGLGLAVCFELATSHGLDLTVASKKNVGTSFSLLIPRA